MQATLEHIGNDLICRTVGSTTAECRVDGDTLQPALQALSDRYDRAVQASDQDALAAIGHDLLGLLNASGWATAWVAGAGSRTLEIRVTDPALPLALALLDAPWELLADNKGFLADDESQLFELIRRIGRPEHPSPPRHADLQLLFMAAAPLGADELDFEAEEAAILQATQTLPLHLVVEESGSAQPLAERVALDGPFEAIHLSCHGNIDAQRGPYLAFEDEQGGTSRAFAGDLARLLGDAQRTPLVFLSACRTAEQANGAAGSARATEPFVRNLVRAGVHNVLGWDGSVFDSDAVAFAQRFYRELATLAPVSRAVAAARQQLRLRNLTDPREGRHWHLARLYLGAQGGGALAAKGQPKRKLASTSQANQFLDAQRNEVPVASRLAFVGRRRSLQAVMRAFSAGSTGVLVHGMGNLGKSSLAHRLATRMSSHRTVVVFKQYDALAIIDRLLDALPPAQRQSERNTWRDAVLAQPSVLADALEAWLEGPFDAQPILLVIDDLERVLETPAPDAVSAATPVRAAWQAPLLAVLAAFAKVNTASRLLLTSRYTFRLPDGQGRDLAAALTRVPLRPMAPRERIKQLRAAATVEQLGNIDLALAERALAVADGNPGLQATLMTPLLAGEPDAARRAVEVIEHFLRSGVPPQTLDDLVTQGVAQDQGNALLAFFRRMAFDVYRAALTLPQARLLACACAFAPDLPIPHSALCAAGVALGVDAPEEALQRLLALGLLDDWNAEATAPAASANPLARPLADALPATDAQQLATAAVPLLATAWRDTEGDIAHDARAVELVRLALLAPQCDPNTLDGAATAAARHLFRPTEQGQHALDAVLRPVLSRLETVQHPISSALARIAFDCATRLGDRAMRDGALHAVAAVTGAQDAEAGSNLLRLAEANRTAGDVTEAERCLHQALSRFEAAGDVRSKALTMGYIADILQARGQLDEALRIRQQEQLPVYERLGDVREKAITMGKVADILQARGQLDEALRILQQEVQPAFERLGDVRSKAVTMGKVTDILQARGQLDEALRIIEQEVQPAFERLGDVRSKAVTMGKVANILQARGQLDEALRMHEDRMATFEALRDAAGLAHVRFAIASLMLARGDHEQGGMQTIYEHLAEAFEIGRRMEQADAVAAIGTLLSQVLVAVGRPDEALGVLDQAEAAHALLGNTADLGQVAEIRAAIQVRNQGGEPG